MGRQIEPYGSSYYAAEGLDPELRSPRVVVPLITSILRPRSVVDVGCGVGRWLSVFRENGIERIQGLDGQHIDAEWLVIPRECFSAIDLSQPFRLHEQFDLALCLEVAEHLPKESAKTIVQSLVCLAPVILFSAAIPFQGGTHHVNEQWPEYWQRLFREHHYQMIDLVRKHIWKNPDVKFWYRQNMFLYVRDDLTHSRPEFVEATQFADDLLLVHSEILERQLGVVPTLKALPVRIWKASRSRLRTLMTRS
jgi:SAM-dependent methyltransferase